MAAAQSPDSSSGSANAAEGNKAAGKDTASPAASGGEKRIGSLPFTGMDLLVVSGVALVLTGTGLALRRFSTPRRTGFELSSAGSIQARA